MDHRPGPPGPGPRLPHDPLCLHRSPGGLLDAAESQEGSELAVEVAQVAGHYGVVT